MEDKKQKPKMVISFLHVPCIAEPNQTGDEVKWEGVTNHFGTKIILIHSSIDEQLWFSKVEIDRDSADCKSSIVICHSAMTLEECEQKTLRSMHGAINDITVASLLMGNSLPISIAVSRFIDRWRELPPLVRAGVGMGEVDRMANDLTRRQRRLSFGPTWAQLPRRKRVESLFQKADMILLDLWTALTATADREAGDMGIDSDVRYENKNDMGLVASMPSKLDLAEAENEAIRQMTTSVVEDIDKGVLGEIKAGTEPPQG